MPKKITQINPPNNRPQKIPSNHPFTGITWIAVSTAIPILVKMMIIVPFRIEIHGSGGGKIAFELDFLSAFIFFLFATTYSSRNFGFL